MPVGKPSAARDKIKGGMEVPKETKEALYQQFKTNIPQIEEVISECLTDDNVIKPLLHYVKWLRANEISPLYSDFEGQSPFWEVEYKGKRHFIVWNGKNNICIMIKATFTKEFQATISEHNLQDIVLDNLQYCSRNDGGHCNNCHLPSHVAGVDEVIFGKVINNLCCGQFISFDNPNSETVEGIKRLLEY